VKNSLDQFGIMSEVLLAEIIATLFASYQPPGVVDPPFWFIERRYWVVYTAWIVMFEVTMSCRGLDKFPSDQPVNACRTSRDALIKDWICTVTSPVGTVATNWVEVKLYLTPLISTQMLPEDVMLAGTFMDRVGPRAGPTFTLNDAMLFALLGSLIV